MEPLASGRSAAPALITATKRPLGRRVGSCGQCADHGQDPAIAASQWSPAAARLDCAPALISESQRAHCWSGQVAKPSACSSRKRLTRSLHWPSFPLWTLVLLFCSWHGRQCRPRLLDDDPNWEASLRHQLNYSTISFKIRSTRGSALRSVPAGEALSLEEFSTYCSMRLR